MRIYPDFADCCSSSHWKWSLSRIYCWLLFQPIHFSNSNFFCIHCSLYFRTLRLHTPLLQILLRWNSVRDLWWLLEVFWFAVFSKRRLIAVRGTDSSMSLISLSVAFRISGCFTEVALWNISNDFTCASDERLLFCPSLQWFQFNSVRMFGVSLFVRIILYFFALVLVAHILVAIDCAVCAFVAHPEFSSGNLADPAFLSGETAIFGGTDGASFWRILGGWNAD